VTSDCLVDRLEAWWASGRGRFRPITTLVLTLDNGPANHSRRTQVMGRLVGFVAATGLTVRLASYPPYHSKDHPIERCWAILEPHWNGAWLDAVEAVLCLAGTMRWKGTAPGVQVVTTTYQTGVALTTQAMAEVETHLARVAGLEKWFIDIVPPPAEVGLGICS
jgi:DDE family transposase